MSAASIYDAPTNPALKPMRRRLIQLIGVKSGGIYNARAERLVLRALFRDWPETTIEQLLARLLEHAEQLDKCFHTYNHERRQGARHDISPAQANGWGSAGQCPAWEGAKTPATGEQFCTVGAAAGNGGAFHGCVSLQQGSQGVIV